MNKYACANQSMLLSCKADVSPIDPTLLGEHLACCKSSLGRMFRMRCLAESIRGFIAARIVTTLLGVAVLMAFGFTFV